jgi:hypothetical protein
MNAEASTTASTASWHQRWQHFSTAAVHSFHVYANWLVGISWRRFIAYSLLLIVAVAVVHDSPPFTWTFRQELPQGPRVVIVPKVIKTPKAPEAPVQPAPSEPAATPQPPAVPKPPKGDDQGVDISIDKNGIRIIPRNQAPARAASAADAAADTAERAADAAASAAKGIQITLPPGAAADSVREAVAEARRQIAESIAEARQEAEQAARDAAEARRDAEKALEDLMHAQEHPEPKVRITRVGIGDFLLQLSWLWVLASAVIKYTYKGRMQAEVKAAQATETAEAESLKRQVVEARMAAMQAQVEPHFLFNTLASIDHLIETDPARASVMQKNLIALLRASMPTMREASGGSANGLRDLGREIAVIRPYLEILKVRMEERLTTEVAVPDGLLSAEFPPMMVQTLVENAIKHGLEPKPEGGNLRVAAEIVHGKLQISVADTGLGFGKAATAGTGVGLANIRERLQLLYGTRATLTVAENQPTGVVVTITVPYTTIEGAGA